MRYVYPGSEFFLSRIRKNSFHPEFASKNLSILTPKKVTKLLEIWSGLFIPDPDPDILPIPYPGYRGLKGTGSRIRNIVRNIVCRRSSLREGSRSWSGSGVASKRCRFTTLEYFLRKITKRLDSVPIFLKKKYTDIRLATDILVFIVSPMKFFSLCDSYLPFGYQMKCRCSSALCFEYALFMLIWIQDLCLYSDPDSSSDSNI